MNHQTFFAMFTPGEVDGLYAYKGIVGSIGLAFDNAFFWNETVSTSAFNALVYQLWQYSIIDDIRRDYLYSQAPTE